MDQMTVAKQARPVAEQTAVRAEGEATRLTPRALGPRSHLIHSPRRSCLRVHP